MIWPMSGTDKGNLGLAISYTPYLYGVLYTYVQPSRSKLEPCRTSIFCTCTNLVEKQSIIIIMKRSASNHGSGDLLLSLVLALPIGKFNAITPYLRTAQRLEHRKQQTSEYLCDTPIHTYITRNIYSLERGILNIYSHINKIEFIIRIKIIITQYFVLLI